MGGTSPKLVFMYNSIIEKDLSRDFSSFRPGAPWWRAEVAKYQGLAVWPSRRAGSATRGQYDENRKVEKSTSGPPFGLRSMAFDPPVNSAQKRFRCQFSIFSPETRSVRATRQRPSRVGRDERLLSAPYVIATLLCCKITHTYTSTLRSCLQP